jgi:hypothetical protein
VAHLAGLIVSDRLQYFRPSVHDERAIAGDRFIDGLSAEDKKHCVLFYIQVNAFPSGA